MFSDVGDKAKVLPVDRGQKMPLKKKEVWVTNRSLLKMVFHSTRKRTRKKHALDIL
jgi:hypothetical protein